MIIDRMLPGLDGLAIVKTLRGAGVKAPVLFLTTMSDGYLYSVGRVGLEQVLCDGCLRRASHGG